MAKRWAEYSGAEGLRELRADLEAGIETLKGTLESMEYLADQPGMAELHDQVQGWIARHGELTAENARLRRRLQRLEGIIERATRLTLPEADVEQALVEFLKDP